MKKWTYLVAAVLMSGTAPFFTSCIDNDEPEGITVLRKAKAELINAKKAIADAEAAEKLAQAELLRAEIEVKQAEAAIKKAQADLIKAQTEGEKAKIEAEIKKIEAEAQLVLAQAEAAAQAAADAHAEALKKLEILQATLQKEQQAALKIWTDRYDEARKAADEKKLAYNKAQRAYTKALNDSKVYDANDVEKMNEIKAEIRKAEKRLKDLQDIELAGLLAEMEAAKGLKPGELPTRLEAVKKVMDNLKADYAKVELQLAEMKKNDADVTKLAELEKAADELYKEELTAAEFKLEFPEIGVPGYNGEEQIHYEIKYSLDKSTMYDFVNTALDTWESRLEGLKLDENDQAWTDQKIIDLKASQKTLKGKFDAEKKQWQVAVDAYKTADGSVNLEAFDTYAPLKAAVEAYNATLPAYNQGKSELEVAVKAYEDAIDRKEETQTLAEIRQEAYDQADEQLRTIKRQLAGELVALNTKNQAEADKLRGVIRKMDIALQEALLNQYNNPGEEADKAVAEAEKNVAAAWTNLRTFEGKAAKELEALQTANDKKSTAAEMQCQIDKQKADDAYLVKLAEYGFAQKDPALQEAILKAEAVMKEKQAAVKVVKEAVDAAYDKLVEANEAYKDEVRTWNYLTNKYAEINLDAIAGISREHARSLVISRSRNLWGNAIAKDDADSKYDIPSAYLIGLDKDMADAIIRANVKEVKNWQLADYYTTAWFGTFGEVLAGENEILVAEATLKNGEALDALIKQVADHQKAITEAYEAQEAKYEEAQKSYEAQKLVVDEKTKALNDRLAEIKSEERLNSDIAAALQKAVEAAPFEDQFTQGAIDNYVAAIQTNIDAKNEEIKVAEGNVEAKNQKMEDFKNGKLTAVNEAKEAMDAAKDESDLAAQRADDAEELLRKAMAKLEQSAE